MLATFGSGRARRLVPALLVLAMMTWLVVQGNDPPGGALAAAVAPEGASCLDLAGGRILRTCALGLGMVIGGAIGMGANPLLGATAMSLGMHLMLFACT